MKHIVLLILLFVAVWAPAQTVSDVRFKRVDKEVTVTYTLDKAADIRVQVSVDGGVTFGNYLENFSGDAGRNREAGNSPDTGRNMELGHVTADGMAQRTEQGREAGGKTAGAAGELQL